MQEKKLNCPKKRNLAGLTTLIVLFMLLPFFSSVSFSKGNLAKRAERLKELRIDAVKGFSQKSFVLETGKFYRWRIISDGRDEYKVLFPKLSRNAWFEQISINEKEVKPFGSIYAVEFDDEGKIDVFFIPIRPGKYEFFVENYRNSGMLGYFKIE